MASEKIEEIKGKIVSGVFALTGRTFVLQVITFVSTFVLTVILSPNVFGVYFVVSAFISFVSYFSDIGLAASLIQMKEEPGRKEYESVFTVQQLLVGTLTVVSLIFSGTIASYYGLDGNGLFLLRSLIISFFLSSFKTIPSVILERNLEFSRLVIPQIVENLSFYGVTIILALNNAGVSSFAWGALIRGLSGLVVIYLISPWQISIGINIPVIKRLVKFGVPFQTNSLLALVKDDLMTIFLGKILPFTALGYIGWAKKWAEVPLRLIMDSVIRVTFPAFSRLQENRDVLGRALSKSFFFLSYFILPSTAMLILYVSPMIRFIPKYIKWEPALIPFYLYCISSVLASFSSPLLNSINAIGHIRITLVMMVIWTILTWVLTPLFTVLYGYYGTAVAALLISLTVFLPVMLTKKYINFPIIRSVRKPFTATIIAFLTAFPLVRISAGLPLLIASGIVYIAVYSLLSFMLMKEEIAPYIPQKALRIFRRAVFF